MRRRINPAKPQESRVLNKELKRQGGVLTPLIIALAFTFILLLSTESEQPDVALPDIQRKHKEELIQVPKEQAQLEVDRIVAEKAKPVDHATLQYLLPGDGPMNPNLHDSNSLMQHIWYRGQKIDGKTRPQFLNTTLPLAIDTISVATESSLVTLEGQVKTWGSHHSIRYFFGATELDDADPTCSTNITIDDMQKISEYCSGWMCALTRFAHAVGKVGRFYRQELAQQGSTFTLPDFLLVQDDDTYYNMIKMYPYLEQKDPLRATADAGCLVRMPIAEIAFDYPYGGFGLILSKASLEKWIRPVDCDHPRKDDVWETKVCMQLKENLIGEGFAWKNGMSITDLMAAHAAIFPLCRLQAMEESWLLHTRRLGTRLLHQLLWHLRTKFILLQIQ
ncbi:hypothetical protein MHU86_8493 [Fragilaria crotonensis]|nr:hypothetical protein MHU86_8493 [Fragilaria crotonensis]